MSGERERLKAGELSIRRRGEVDVMVMVCVVGEGKRTITKIFSLKLLIILRGTQ